MLAYCDWIADQIKRHFTNDKAENKIVDVGSIMMDLHPIDGYFLSTKKTMLMEDMNGKVYQITVEELNDVSI